jgi:hypothetical protein
MRLSLEVFASTAITAATVVLSACAGGGSGLIAAGNGTPSLARSGLANVESVHRPVATAHRGAHRRMTGPKFLYVSDLGANDVQIFANAGFTNAGSITDSIDGPDGNWVDKSGNLYVANYKARNITEYARRASTPTFVYASGMDDPVGVTTDALGNVYEADFAGGYVNEYNQGTDAVVATCSPGGAVEGVAVDASGNVFVDYYNGSVGAFVEYVGGLSGCAGTVLGVTIGYPGGMVMDKTGALIVCDQTAPAVDVIKPPYGSIKYHLGTGWIQPFHVTFNLVLKEAYVADFGAAAVQVLEVPSGLNVTTLNSTNGLVQPIAAVDGENYIP